MRLLLALASMAFAAVAPAQAQQAVAVAGLLGQGYEIKGGMPSHAGPGTLLDKGMDLVMCFVAETPTSDDIATQYCKPVH